MAQLSLSLASQHFPLFVPPFSLQLYSSPIRSSSITGTSLSSDFDSPSAVGRLIPSLDADKLGPLNVLLTALL